MDKIYIVIQSSGSHAFGDAFEWNLCARFSEEDAKKEVDLLSARHEKVKGIHREIARAYLGSVRSLNDSPGAISQATDFARKMAIEWGADEQDLQMLGFRDSGDFDAWHFNGDDSYHYEELPIE